MLGWINDCVEKLVIEKFGVDAWHAVKEKAGCDVKDNAFLKLEHYSDKSTVALVAAASEISGLSIPQVYEAFGAFFVPYIINEGYENLLCCQGSTLRDWMTNINAIHQHLQTTFPKKMTMPEFWIEENNDGTMRLFYFSSRGSFLAPLAVGLVKEVARMQFQLDITMTLVTTQGVDGSRFTSWTVSTVDSADIPKLKTKQGGRNGVANVPTSFKCPMSGLEISANDIPSLVVTTTQQKEEDNDPTKNDEFHAPIPESNKSKGCPFHRGGQSQTPQSEGKRLSLTTTNSTQSSGLEDSVHGGGPATLRTTEPGGLSAAATRRLFPYHVVLDSEFCIKQVGDDLPKVLGTTESILYGDEIDEIFDFVKPRPAKWTRSWMRKLENQEFVLESSLSSVSADLTFKGTLVATNPGEIMLILCPDAKSLEELRDMKLTLSDLPAHGAYRDAVFLREHLSRQMNNALKMEKLSKTLQNEKELLESLIPVHAAEGLRKGQAVKPRLHNNVTMFFSDIVGFTNICKHISPWQVIEMLNELYGIMDFLAKKFNLFKVETIGDAYVCCSGLPESDEKHAMNVANFAVAVQHCCQRVLSPLDHSPIKLRIGINSGPCASGIVGVTNPRYCVFGDTVNTTARHESTGEAGRVHCSLTTMIEIQKYASQQFDVEARGMVAMKGRGELPTYWVNSTASNTLTNTEALLHLDNEITRVVNLGKLGVAATPGDTSDVSTSTTVTSSSGVEDEAVRRNTCTVFNSSPSRSNSNSTSFDSASVESHITSESLSSTLSRKELSKLLLRSRLQSRRSQRTERRRKARTEQAAVMDEALRLVEQPLAA